MRELLYPGVRRESRAARVVRLARVRGALPRADAAAAEADVRIQPGNGHRGWLEVQVRVDNLTAWPLVVTYSIDQDEIATITIREDQTSK